MDPTTVKPILTDFFGNPFRVGQRVLHISRHSSYLGMDINTVTKVTCEGVWTKMPPTPWTPNPRDTKVVYPERLVIHPEDIAQA